MKQRWVVRVAAVDAHAVEYVDSEGWDAEHYHTFLGPKWDTFIVVDVEPHQRFQPHDWARDRAVVGKGIVFESRRTRELRRHKLLEPDFMVARRWGETI
jgi:hypothetical protein